MYTITVPCRFRKSKKERKSHPVKLSIDFKVFSFMNDVTDQKLLSGYVAC